MSEIPPLALAVGDLRRSQDAANALRDNLARAVENLRAAGADAPSLRDLVELRDSVADASGIVALWIARVRSARIVQPRSTNS